MEPLQVEYSSLLSGDEAANSLVAKSLGRDALGLVIVRNVPGTQLRPNLQFARTMAQLKEGDRKSLLKQRGMGTDVASGTIASTVTATWNTICLPTSLTPPPNQVESGVEDLETASLRLLGEWLVHVVALVGRSLDLHFGNQIFRDVMEAGIVYLALSQHHSIIFFFHLGVARSLSQSPPDPLPVVVGNECLQVEEGGQRS